MSIQTFTYTWTMTRLETIQDQFRFLLIYAGVADKDIDQVVHGVGQKAVKAVGVYGCDASKLRVIEAELRVDWTLNAKLTLTTPVIKSGLSGWEGKQAPEVKVAGRRFADAAREMGLFTNYWVRFVKSVSNDPDLYARWKEYMGLGGSAPQWKSSPKERNETFLDLGEASVYIRRAGG